MKLDTSKIDGYDTMTAEQKLEALANYEIDLTGFVKKETFDKTASEVAKLKKEKEALMSEDELRKAKIAEEQKALHEKVAELEKEKNLAKYQNLLTGKARISAEDATALAEKLHAGEIDSVFDAFSKVLAKHDKEVADMKATLTAKGLQPASGTNPGGEPTIEQFKKMGYADLAKMQMENPLVYAKLAAQADKF
jgi:phage I-like protein